MRGGVVWLPSILGASTPEFLCHTHILGLATLNSGGVHPSEKMMTANSLGLATLNSGGVHPSKQ